MAIAFRRTVNSGGNAIPGVEMNHRVQQTEPQLITFHRFLGILKARVNS
jgi:hypothetical protein